MLGKIIDMTEEKGNKGKTELPLAVRTEKPKPPEETQQAFFLISQNFDFLSKGFVGATVVKRKGGELVPTDIAESISERLNAATSPSEKAAIIADYTWEMEMIRRKTGDKGPLGMQHLWDALSGKKNMRIGFTSNADAVKAHDILIEAGFSEDMLTVHGDTLKILKVPEKINLEKLTDMLATKLMALRQKIAAKEEAIAAAAQKARDEAAAESTRKIYKHDPALDGRKADVAAADIQRIYKNHMIDDESRYSVWYYLNMRPDSQEVIKIVRNSYPFKGFEQKDFDSLIALMKAGKKFPGMVGEAAITRTGREHEELRAYETQKRGGPSEVQKAASTQWRMPESARIALEKGDRAEITCVSAEDYAKKRATMEALYPGRAISLERDTSVQNEWTLIVHPQDESANDAVEVAGGIRKSMGSKAADARVNWTHEGKKQPLSVAAAAYDAVNNYSTYTAVVTINPSDQSTIPDWFRSLITGKKLGQLGIKDNLRKDLLAKGVELKADVHTIENRDGSNTYVYTITISGENVRKPLEVARNEARSKPKATLPEPQLKRIAAFEEPAGELTYADRVAALKDKLKKTKPES